MPHMGGKHIFTISYVFLLAFRISTPIAIFTSKFYLSIVSKIKGKEKKTTRDINVI